ncbi:MAG: hypothetical protein WCF18_11550 [Chthoniobacteraceae bacterium]
MTHPPEMSVTAAARTLGISRRTIQRYLSKKVLKKGPNGGVLVKEVESAASTVRSRAKKRGRPLRTLPPAQRSFRLPKPRGYFLGKTDAQRVEIIIREIGAIRDDLAILALSKWLGATLVPSLKEWVEHAEEAITKAAQSFPDHWERFLRITTQHRPKG